MRVCHTTRKLHNKTLYIKKPNKICVYERTYYVSTYIENVQLRYLKTYIYVRRMPATFANI